MNSVTTSILHVDLGILSACTNTSVFTNMNGQDLYSVCVSPFYLVLIPYLS